MENPKAAPKVQVTSNKTNHGCDESLLFMTDAFPALSPDGNAAAYGILSFDG